MRYNVFDTEEEAIAAQEQDYQLFISHQSGQQTNDDWLQKTDKWSNVVFNQDHNKWIYLVYPKSEYTYETQEIEHPISDNPLEDFLG